MKNKLNLTAVSYLNTKPFMYGLVKNGFDQDINISLDIPSQTALKLKSGEADLGLVPVAVIPELPEAHVISDFCIGTVGKVYTVCIYGDCPIEQMDRLYLDYHSRSSVALTKVLARRYWNIAPEMIPAQKGYIDQIGGTTGGLVIGDRTIGLEKRFEYVYDLGQAWLDYTGLPFVFAAWISTRPLPADFVARFNEALAEGVRQIPQLVYLIPSPRPDFDLQHYFTHHISYQLDTKKKKALQIFLKMVNSPVQPVLV
ncbi:MAG: menaquinone biosynthesis protein [Bacteroidota bacterium]